MKAHCIKEGLIDKDNPAEDFYERLHLNSDLLSVNLTDVSDDEFHKALLEANNELTRHYFEKQIESYVRQYAISQTISQALSQALSQAISFTSRVELIQTNCFKKPLP